MNNVFDRRVNKYLSEYSRPVTLVIAANYTLPILDTNSVLSWAVRDWRIGAVLQYGSGLPILAPSAQNALNGLLYQSTFANRVPGEPLFAKDLNSGNLDPQKDFVLNPKAWVDPAPGEFATGTAYYSDYRYQRRPNEAMSIGRIFRIKEGVSLQIRAEFTNIFNRTQMSDPYRSNAKRTQRRNSAGQPTSGFGWIRTSTVASPPREGTIVIRFSF